MTEAAKALTDRLEYAAYTWEHSLTVRGCDMPSPAMLREAKAEIERLRAALLQIAELHPDKDSSDGHNEWGEAECFGKAQEIAKHALGLEDA